MQEIFKSSAAANALFALALAFLFTLSAGNMSAHAQDASGPFQGMRQSDEPVQIEADRLEVEDKKGRAQFDGNVSVIQGSTILKTSHLTVYYYSSGEKGKGKGKPGGNIRRIEASGKVAVRSEDQKATAESMVYDMATQTVALTGNVKVSQGANIMEGCKLTVNLQNNQAKFSPCGGNKGRVRGIFTPGSVNTN